MSSIQDTQKIWIRNGRNSILEADGFYISYNASPGVIPSFSGDDGSDETALVENNRYYILNGDHREDYEKLVDQGFAACARYFLAHEDQQSSWSNDLSESDLPALLTPPQKGNSK